MNMNIASLLSAYRDQRLTPEQVVDEILTRCDAYAEHNIWITRLSREQLLPYLERLKNYQVDDLPLYGIPFAIKDNIDLAGVATTAACAEFAYTPEKSAFVVEQLIQAGAIPIGKTNMDQFATGLVGTRSPWGACQNAFKPEYISGGSSSGSAVAVALGLVSFSLGTDTAGSGRVPAAFNNIVGLKPSRGLLGMNGVVPACRSLDCVSIFAFTTDDANCVFDVAATYDADDDYARDNPFTNSGRFYGVPQTPFRFAVPLDEQLEFFGNASARILFQQALEKMQALGGEMQRIDFSPFLQAAKLLYEGPWVAERYVAIEDMITAQPEKLLPVIRTIIGSAEGKTAVDAFKAEYQMQQHRRTAHALLSQVDFLLTPTVATIYTIEEIQQNPIGLNSNLGYYTNYMNLLDCAAVSVPVGYLDNGLPWGVTLVDVAMQDRKLLSYAAKWQQAASLPMGASDEPSSISAAAVSLPARDIPVVVCGAHLDGLPLNWQLRERGASLLEKTYTTKSYRMYALEGDAVKRPGLVRNPARGESLEVEIWSVPATEFGSFVANIPAPLGIGKVEVADGRWLPGFICEPWGIEHGLDISQLGGWRAYLNS